MQILLNVPDEYQADFLRLFVPSGTIDTEWYGRGQTEEGFLPFLEFPVEIEQVYTDGKNHRE